MDKGMILSDMSAISVIRSWIPPSFCFGGISFLRLDRKISVAVGAGEMTAPLEAVVEVQVLCRITKWLMQGRI